MLILTIVNALNRCTSFSSRFGSRSTTSAIPSVPGRPRRRTVWRMPIHTVHPTLNYHIPARARTLTRRARLPSRRTVTNRSCACAFMTLVAGRGRGPSPRTFSSPSSSTSFDGQMAADIESASSPPLHARSTPNPRPHPHDHCTCMLASSPLWVFSHIVPCPHAPLPHLHSPNP